ncbi:MAG: hypothetical protein ABGZ35_25675 [Planctomycetaceae bacterium]
MNSRGPVGLGRKAVRAASGGLVVIVALLVLLFMQGPGTGSGDGEVSETADANGEAPAVVSTDAVSDTMLQSDAEDGGLTDQEQAAVAGNTLIVLIDEHDYFMQVPENETTAWQPMELTRLVEVAQRAAGDSNGIRVRIQKRSTARASAEQKVRSELEQAGIGVDAIFESSELVD